MDQNRDTIHRILAIVERYLDGNRDPGTPVIEYRKARDLRNLIDLSLAESGVALDRLPGLLETYLAYSVRTGHPQFLNQLYGGFCAAGLVGDLASSLTNTSMYTYEVAPVATLMELTLIEKMNSLLGFVDGEGIFCTGGSNANMIGALCARDRAFPEIRTAGYRGDERPVMFVSDEAHYSFAKAANLLGVGWANVIRVATDPEGRMVPRRLEEEIERSRDRGCAPFFVGATAGTTVKGAFDPLFEIAEICSREGLWLHVDGSWGGPVILSKRHRRLLEGSERADSFAWDAHKSMGVTLTCSAFLTRHRGVLRRACAAEAVDPEYLFHGGDDAELDLGRSSLQCGRRVDALRLWMIWKHFGDSGLERRVDRLFELARSAEERVAAHPHLELMAPVQSLNVCFRHVATGSSDVDAFNLELRERLRKSGRSFVNYSTLNGRVALRLVLANPELTDEDLVRFFDRLLDEAGRLRASRGRQPQSLV